MQLRCLSVGTTYEIGADDWWDRLQAAERSSGSSTLSVGGDNSSTKFSGGIGTGGLTKQGTGTLTLSGVNTHSGPTSVTEGTLRIANIEALGSGSSFSLDNGTLSFAVSPSGALGDPSGSLALGSNGGVLDVDAGQSLAISGVVSGSGALTKTGAGELSLAGTNTYTGSTTIDNGTLSVSGSIGNTSRVSVSEGTTFRLGGIPVVRWRVRVLSILWATP